MINNRQNGRRRGRGGGQQRPQNGGGGHGGGQGQRDSGNRIDSRARGNATQLHEKYRNMARDAQMQGDRVNTEYYLQFADHYFRVMSDQRGRYDEQAPRRARDDFDGDDDFGFEGEPARHDEQSRGPDDSRREEGNREDGRRDDPRRDDSRRDLRQDDARRDQNGRDDTRRPANGNYAGGGDGNAVRRDRQDQRREESAGYARPEGAARPNVAPASPPDKDESGEAATNAAPRKRTRMRKPPEDAAETAAFDAAILPPSIATVAETAGDEPPVEPKPRRRRTPRAAEGEVSQAS